MTDTSKKPREFWIDRELIAHFRKEDIPPSRGSENIHVIEYSAYQSLQAEIEYLKRMLADERSGDSDKDKTIRRLKSNNQAFQSLKEQCEKLEKALEFYGDDKNWSDNKFIVKSDVELRDNEFNDPCGKRARQTLTKYFGSGK